MELDLSVSIIVPAYNAENTIKECLKNILEESKKFDSEIIVIDDNSTDKTFDILKNYNSIKLIKLKKNMGVGYVRNLGAKIAKNDLLCYVDSDLIISKSSILFLIQKLLENKNIGSVGAIQEVKNLNSQNWSSNFVCLKSCYGFDQVEKEIEFSVIHSEFCVISKKFLNDVGGWKSFKKAGGEEFDLGYRICQFGKKIILVKNASYKTYYASLYIRFKKIIDRTEKYLHIFLKKKKFDTTGSFATFDQAISSFLTLIIICLVLSSIYINKDLLIIGLSVSFFIQIIVEYKFLLFAKKYFGFRMLFFSIFGIQIINLGILLGVNYFFLKKIYNFLKI